MQSIMHEYRNMNCFVLVASKKQPATVENCLLLEGDPAAITSMTGGEPVAATISMTHGEPLPIASVTDGEPLPITSVTDGEPAAIESMTVAIREPVAIEPSPSDNPEGRMHAVDTAGLLLHTACPVRGSSRTVKSEPPSHHYPYQLQAPVAGPTAIPSNYKHQ